MGIDRSEDFLVLASRLDPSGAYFVRADASALPFQDAFDAAISLCCGGFGLSRSALHAEDASLPLPSPDPDEQILRSIAGALVPGGCLALTAFSAYFQVRYLDAGDQFDPASGMNRETTVLLDAEGSEKRAELFTTCFTPRELCLLSERAGLTPLHVWSVGPGEYARRPPDLQHPELLLIARRV